MTEQLKKMTRDAIRTRSLTLFKFSYEFYFHWSPGYENHAKQKQTQAKTRAAHFPIWRDERTGMQWATLGKSGSETASYRQGPGGMPYMCHTETFRQSGYTFWPSNRRQGARSKF